MLTQSNMELKEEMLRNQMRLSQQMLSLNKQIQVFFQTQQASDSGSQQPSINHQQNDEN